MFLILAIFVIATVIFSNGTEQLYYLYTRNNPNTPKQVLDDICFDNSKPTKFIVHGFFGIGLSGYSLLIKDAILKWEDCNIIIMDWSKKFGDYGDYTTAARYAKFVGKVLGDHLYYEYGNYDNIHIIGMGLGSHLAGFAGKQIRKYSEGKTLLGRISAIDPAFPLFNVSDPNERLDKTDASMVIVYHCDGKKLGIFDPIGKVDFYINGGVAPQPGCHEGNTTFVDFLSGKLDELECSHYICRRYFAVSINRNDTIGTKCNSTLNYNAGLCNGNEKIAFGENLPNDANGTFYLNLTANYGH